MTGKAKILIATMTWVTKHQLISAALVAQLLSWILTHPNTRMLSAHQRIAALIHENVLLAANRAGVVDVDLVPLNRTFVHACPFIGRLYNIYLFL